MSAVPEPAVVVAEVEPAVRVWCITACIGDTADDQHRHGGQSNDQAGASQHQSLLGGSTHDASRPW
jgi:hypothetical protein